MRYKEVMNDDAMREEAGETHVNLNQAFKDGGYKGLEEAIEKEIEKYETDTGEELSKAEKSEVRRKITRIFQVQEEANKILKSKKIDWDNQYDYIAAAFDCYKALGKEDIGYHDIWVKKNSDDIPLDEAEIEHEVQLLPFSEYITKTISLKVGGFFYRIINEIDKDGLTTSAFIREVMKQVVKIKTSYEVPWESVCNAARVELFHAQCKACAFSYDDIVELVAIDDKIERVKKLGELYSERKKQVEDRKRKYKDGEDIKGYL